jgi:hypothetical protein
MTSIYEQPKSNHDKTCTSNPTFAPQVPVRRHVDLLSSPNNSPEQILVLKSPKTKAPLDYLIWSSMLVISGMLIFGFVVVILLLAAYKHMGSGKM